MMLNRVKTRMQVKCKSGGKYGALKLGKIRDNRNMNVWLLTAGSSVRARQGEPTLSGQSNLAGQFFVLKRTFKAIDKETAFLGAKGRPQWMEHAQRPKTDEKTPKRASHTQKD